MYLQQKTSIIYVSKIKVLQNSFLWQLLLLSSLTIKCQNSDFFFPLRDQGNPIVWYIVIETGSMNMW